MIHRLIVCAYEASMAWYHWLICAISCADRFIDLPPLLHSQYIIAFSNQLLFSYFVSILAFTSLFCLQSYCNPILNPRFISNQPLQTICLYSGQMNREGGSTPGKAVFGICVVSCDSVHDLGNGFVRVIPARNIGLFRYIDFQLIISLVADLSLTVIPLQVITSGPYQELVGRLLHPGLTHSVSVASQ